METLLEQSVCRLKNWVVQAHIAWKSIKNYRRKEIVEQLRTMSLKKVPKKEVNMDLPHSVEVNVALIYRKGLSVGFHRNQHKYPKEQSTNSTLQLLSL